jgi:hypothetical protein
MDPASITAVITALAAAIQSVGLGNLIVAFAMLCGAWMMRSGAGKVGKFLASAFITVGKVADKGIDIRLSVKLVDDQGVCVVPTQWGRPQREAPTHRTARPPTYSRVSIPPDARKPPEGGRDLNESSGQWTQQALLAGASAAK